LIEFTNMSITFQQTVIQPRITDVTFSDGKFNLKAKSLTVPGPCVGGSNPSGLVTTQQIQLAVTDLDYTLPLIVGYIQHNICINIQCYSNSHQKCIDVIYGQPDQQDLITGNVTEPILIPPTHNLPKISIPSGTMDWFTDIWNFDNWYDYILAIVSIFVFIIALVILKMIFPPMWSAIKYLLHISKLSDFNKMKQVKSNDLENTVTWYKQKSG